MDASFYRKFQIIVLGLDSIEGARAPSPRPRELRAARGEQRRRAADATRRADVRCARARILWRACARLDTRRRARALPLRSLGAHRRRAPPAARRWINSMVCSLVTYEAGPDGALTPDLSSVIPMIDGGTEGLKGHARVIFPRVSACFECTLDLFPPQVRMYTHPSRRARVTHSNFIDCVLLCRVARALHGILPRAPATQSPHRLACPRAPRRARRFNPTAIGCTARRHGTARLLNPPPIGCTARRHGTARRLNPTARPPRGRWRCPSARSPRRRATPRTACSTRTSSSAIATSRTRRARTMTTRSISSGSI